HSMHPELWGQSVEGKHVRIGPGAHGHAKCTKQIEEFVYLSRALILGKELHGFGSARVVVSNHFLAVDERTGRTYDDRHLNASSTPARRQRVDDWSMTLFVVLHAQAVKHPFGEFAK